MKTKELKQKLSRIQSKAEDLRYQLGRLISELDVSSTKLIDNQNNVNKENNTYENITSPRESVKSGRKDLNKTSISGDDIKGGK